MNIARIGLIFSLAAISGVASAGAQDRGQVGITMGYPASIGIIWHMTDGVALRPELSFARSSSESTTTATLTTFPPGTYTTTSQTTSNTSWQVAVGVSALFYVGKWDALRTYVSPRIAYSRTSFTSSNSTITPLLGPSDTIGSSYFAAGSFGAQYSLAKRFGVFGEVGAGYTRGKTSSGTLGRSESRTNSFGTRSGAGVILYF